jgi:hypothetical protein
MLHDRASRAQDIIASVRIADVWEQLGGPRLRKTGADTYRGRAWWRDGAGENVSLYNSRGGFHDFVTDAGGGILDLIVTVRGGSRADALRWLADLVGLALENRPLTPAERASYARERAAVEQDEPEARLWRRAAVSIAEDLLHALKTRLFDPSEEIEPAAIGEIRNLESLLARLRQMEGATLVREYHAHREQTPDLVRGMVGTMRRRDSAERRALLAYLRATEANAA